MNTPNGSPFECRVCGHDEFHEQFTCEVVESVTHNDTRDTAQVDKCEPSIGYSCCKCSVTFQDPDKFTKNEKILIPHQ